MRLDGPMQAWGTHTFEDFRPSALFPTRSGLLGLLGACLGVDRHDQKKLEQLAESVDFTVRVDKTVMRHGSDTPTGKPAIKLPDFHTVMAARKVDGSANKNPIVSRREYLFDAAFTVAIGSHPSTIFSLDEIAHALSHPFYTPVLGRRSCPITRPLMEKIMDANNAREALAQAAPAGGLIYSENDSSPQPLRIRDVPIRGKYRQFGTRQVFVHKEESCS
jgi:CRISPR system Cascade subunit CasD